MNGPSRRSARFVSSGHPDAPCCRLARHSRSQLLTGHRLQESGTGRGRFARGDKISETAQDLRVTPGSVRRWHRAWRERGAETPRSRGPVSRERLSAQQWARLELELSRGLLAHRCAGDQRWTLGRIKTLIGRLFHVGYTVEGTWKLMRRGGHHLPVMTVTAQGGDVAPGLEPPVGQAGDCEGLGNVLGHVVGHGRVAQDGPNRVCDA